MSEKEKDFVSEPGTMVPWHVKMEELGEFPGNEAVAKIEWEKLEGLAYGFIWFWVQR
ncbi:MAG: hypothetical protein ACOWWO_00465 [Peptococcaceae bacterium]